MERLCKAIPSMLSWVQRFLCPQPAQNAKVEAGIGQGPGGSSGFPICVRQVICISAESALLTCLQFHDPAKCG